MRGKLIEFEGGDGSGKGTQSKLLFNHMSQELGVPTRFETFPRYHTPTGKQVAAYLNGDLGDVSPEDASLLFSNDRLAARDELEEWLEAGGSWVLDRYVHSNKGHQGGRLATREDRVAYFNESDHLEFDVNKLPRPDKIMLLTLPPDLAQHYVNQKAARSYTDKKQDIHEADPLHLLNANEAFALFAELNPGIVAHIENMSKDGSERRSPELIHEDIKRAMQPLMTELLEAIG